MEIREVLAQNLKAARLEAGMSQEELAHLADIDRTYISSLERSVYNAGIDLVERLAKALKTEASELLRRRPPEGAFEEERVDQGLASGSVGRSKK